MSAHVPYSLSSHSHFPVPSPAELDRDALSAWPAQETEHAGPLLLRHTQGFTKRSNSACLLAPVMLSKADIASVEAWFASRGRPAIFRIASGVRGTDTPQTRAELALDCMLAARGYTVADPSLVMARSVRDLPLLNTAEAPAFLPADAWLGCEQALSGKSDAERTLLGLIISLTQGRAQLAVRQVDNGPVSCGMLVTQGDGFGLFDIRTHAAHRRQGHARAMVLGLLQHARDLGLSTGWLQVLETNTPAVSLYAGLGFTLSHRYHYRIQQ